jgi:hypothetical protein
MDLGMTQGGCERERSSVLGLARHVVGMKPASNLTAS